MRFSIITPSFRNSDWLKLCIASVADQGVELEHIVQDSCSDDGPQEWVLSLLENKVPMGILDELTSVFADTGDNMNLRPNAQRERVELQAKAPAWARRSRGLVVACYRLRRLLAGHYRKRPAYSYSLY